MTNPPAARQILHEVFGYPEFRGRQERFVNTPAYKTAVGEWEIHCRNKTYRLTALQLIDERGQVLMNERYTATNLRPMSVMSGTLTEKQFEVVCKK